MITVVLDVVVLEKKVRALQPEIVRLAALRAAHPGKSQLIEIDTVGVGRLDLGLIVTDHLTDDAANPVTLNLVQRADRHTDRLQCFDPRIPLRTIFAQIGGENLAWRAVRDNGLRLLTLGQ